MELSKLSVRYTDRNDELNTAFNVIAFSELYRPALQKEAIVYSVLKKPLSDPVV